MQTSVTQSTLPPLFDPIVDTLPLPSFARSTGTHLCLDVPWLQSLHSCSAAFAVPQHDDSNITPCGKGNTKEPAMGRPTGPADGCPHIAQRPVGGLDASPVPPSIIIRHQQRVVDASARQTSIRLDTSKAETIKPWTPLSSSRFSGQARKHWFSVCAL